MILRAAYLIARAIDCTLFETTFWVLMLTFAARLDESGQTPAFGLTDFAPVPEEESDQTVSW